MSLAGRASRGYAVHRKELNRREEGILAKVLLLGLVMILGLWPDLGITGGQDLTPREIYERDSSAVVMIIGYSNSGQRGSGGTGSIVQQDGFVLTNAHVVIEEQTGKPYPRLTIYLKPTVSAGIQKRICRGVARVVSWPSHNRWI